LVDVSKEKQQRDDKSFLTPLNDFQKYFFLPKKGPENP
jgi:hypothetical protein